VGARPLPPGLTLFPAEHRGLRELHAAARGVAGHWSALAERLGGEAGDALRCGAATARELLDALAGRDDLPPGYPAAQGVGAWLATVRTTARDLLLERNQALRLALGDARHLVTLLGYLAALAEARDDAALAAFEREWQERLQAVEVAVGDAVLALAADPEAAVAPVAPSAAGRAGHGLANAMGTVGEAFDASPLGRAARRLRVR